MELLFFRAKQNIFFSVSSATASKRNDIQIQADRIENIFGSTNGLAIIIPSGDYEKEALLISELEHYEEIDMVVGLANTEALDDYTLTQSLTAIEFSELME